MGRSDKGQLDELIGYVGRSAVVCVFGEPAVLLTEGMPSNLRRDRPLQPAEVEVARSLTATAAIPANRDTVREWMMLGPARALELVSHYRAAAEKEPPPSLPDLPLHKAACSILRLTTSEYARFIGTSTRHAATLVSRNANTSPLHDALAQAIVAADDRNDHRLLRDVRCALSVGRWRAIEILFHREGR